MNYNTIQALARAYPGLEGSKILALLIRHPNRPIFSTVLELALSTDLSVDEAEASIYHPSAIPMTDERALKEIDKRLLRLNQLKAQYLSETGGNSNQTSRGFSENGADLSDTRAGFSKTNSGICDTRAGFSEKGAGFSEKNAESSPYDAEIKELIRYRLDCTRPNGAPKSFPDEYRRAYRRHAAAIRRLLAKADHDGHHEAVAIVKRALKLGRMASLNLDMYA